MRAGVEKGRFCEQGWGGGEGSLVYQRRECCSGQPEVGNNSLERENVEEILLS